MMINVILELMASVVLNGINTVRWFQLEFKFPKLVLNALSHRVIPIQERQ